MEERVFSGDAVGELASKFVKLKIDGRADRELSRRARKHKLMQGNTVPQVVLVNQRLRVLGRFSSRARIDAKQAAEELDRALNRNQSWTTR